jgi:uncharacterized protein YigE (DUF2233 family)
MYYTLKHSPLKYTMYGFFAAIIFVSNSGSTNPTIEKQSLISDSSQTKLQNLIDSLYKEVLLYTDLASQKIELQGQIEVLTNENSIIADSLQRLNAFSLEAICVELTNKKNDESIKANLKKIYKDIEIFEVRKEKLQNDIREKESSIKSIAVKMNSAENDFNRNKEVINNFTATLTGPGYLALKNAKYRFYIARNSDSIHIHSNTKRNSGQSLNDILSYLKKNKSEALMITNAGMYTKSYEAQGLLVEDSKIINKIDTLKPDNKENLNFYMQPNGIFYIDSNGFNIAKTDDYKIKYLLKSKVPRFATQSGPMLLYGGIRNPKFKNGSQNLNIRSGVGAINKDKIVFIISDTPVNFYDFASVFDDIFNSKNALYLDGAISKMYIDETLSGTKNPNNNDGAFGPIISVSRKQK